MIRYQDLRPLPAAEAFQAISLSSGQGSGLVVTSWQLSKVSETDPRPLIITIPDFLNYARLVNTGQPVSILRLPGRISTTLKSGIAAGLHLAPRLAKLRKQSFWLGGQTLAAFDLAMIKPNSKSIVMLHQNLTDFALFFGRHDILRSFISKVRKQHLQVGFHTQQPARLVSIIVQHRLTVDALGFPISIHSLEHGAEWKNAINESCGGPIKMILESAESDANGIISDQSVAAWSDALIVNQR